MTATDKSWLLLKGTYENLTSGFVAEVLDGFIFIVLTLVVLSFPILLWILVSKFVKCTHKITFKFKRYLELFLIIFQVLWIISAFSFMIDYLT